jgi:hypothetical protein
MSDVVPRDIYIAIMRAAARGEGLRLSADECGQLSIDDAIATRASNALAEGEWPVDWSKCNPAFVTEERKAPP